MIDEVEKQGVLKTIIKKACEMSEEALADLGRGGKRGYLAFRELTTEKEGETQDVANFRQSLNSRLQASEALSSALEEQLTRRFPKHLRWDRKAVAGPKVGPTVKTIGHDNKQTDNKRVPVTLGIWLSPTSWHISTAVSKPFLRRNNFSVCKFSSPFNLRSFRLP